MHVYPQESKYEFFIQFAKKIPISHSTEGSLGSPLPLVERTIPNSESLGRNEKCKMGKQQTILRASRRGGVRSKNNRKKKQNKIINFTIMGTNAAGLKAKRDSLLSNIEFFNFPSCITIQESK